MSISSTEPGDASPRRLLPVLFVGVFMAALDTAVIGPAIPALRAAFGVDNRDIGLVMSVFVLFSLCSTALMSNLSDRYGRRSVYLASVGCFALGSLAIAASPRFWILIVSRAVQGVGAGGITPTASAVVGDVFPPAERGRALGLIGATYGMAFVLGPPLAGVLLVALSWHWIFLINLPIAAVILFLGMRALPAGRPAGSGHPALDVAGIAATFALLACFVLGITRLADPFFGVVLWPWFLGAAAAFCVLLIRIERRAALPIIPFSLFANRQLATAYALTVGSGFGMGAVIFLPSIAAFAYDVPAKKVGFVLLPLVVASMLGSVGAGRLLNRLGPRELIAAGFVLLGAGYGATAVTGHGLFAFLAASVPVGLGIGIVVGGALRSIAIDEAPVEVRGAAQGLINICTAIGTLLSAAAISAVADFGGGRTAGFALAYAGVAALMAAMLLLTLTLRARHTAVLDPSIGPLVAAGGFALAFRSRPARSGRPQGLLVLLHGLNNDETELAALAAAADPDLLVVMPRGRIDMGRGRFGWFHVEFAAAGPRRINAAEADASRLVLIRFVEQVQAANAIAAHDTVVAGFSQGGIASASVALSAPERLAGFGILGGRILPELEPHLAAPPALHRLRAFVGHGTADEILPVACAHHSAERLDALGIPRTTRLYAGGHWLSPEMIADFVQWLRGLLPPAA